MKKFIVVILVMALITGSLMSILGASADMLVSPLPYLARFNNVIENFPEAKKHSYQEALDSTEPSYKSLWQSYSGRSLSSGEIKELKDVVDAIGNFFTGIIDRIAYFFTSLGKCLIALWDNLLMTFKHWLSPVRVFVLNVGSVVSTLFKSGDWFVCLALAAIPFDWQRSRAHKVPLFGNISERPLDQYFGNDWR